MNHYNPQKHHRRSIRLQGYDYSREGLYFVTICCQDRAHLFGEIAEKCLQLNDAGIQAQQCWLDIPNHFPNVVLHEFVIMPNHIHGIIEFVGANNYSPNPLLPHQPLPHNFGVNDPEMGNGEKNIEMANGAKDFSLLWRSPSKTIGSVVRGFKIGVTKWMRNNTNVVNVWQRNYYDHIIRYEKDYHRISEYIKNNPILWKEDRFYDNGI
ncbi:hypothetical protein H9Q08_05255 [Chryseobacterium sp. PS-8]|uniref:Transposase IS200-like domain-containing protein n=1 Tax=Chryseobacterium indicum TaxID=2766954 RepID=A0ABS9C2C1_9FLAO|nr:transposase [Chryseobacterium sp. PS-8]MCF2218706.1 hypothetical protein [Chryseobacterium sp. PS-8]